MELGEKLQQLRKQKGMTQQELADRLYVSRTAISKWESGRGYPSIESLKAIAALFSVTVDDLLSSEEILALAASVQKQTAKKFRDLAFGLADLAASLLLFLPLFANRAGGGVVAASLLSLLGAAQSHAVMHLLLVIATAVTGACLIGLQSCDARLWVKMKIELSLALSAISVLAFMLGLHPYAASFAFMLLAMKVILLIRRT